MCLNTNQNCDYERDEEILRNYLKIKMMCEITINDRGLSNMLKGESGS